MKPRKAERDLQEANAAALIDDLIDGVGVAAFEFDFSADPGLPGVEAILRQCEIDAATSLLAFDTREGEGT